MTPHRRARHPRALARHAGGSVLIVGLVMLVLLSLIAVSGLRSGTIGVQVAGNAQLREEATAVAQHALEQVISENLFDKVPPNPIDVDVNHDGVVDFNVAFTPGPACQYLKPVDLAQPNIPRECYVSAGMPGVCFWTIWNVTAVATDARTGASVTIEQGVRKIIGIDSKLTYCES